MNGKEASRSEEFGGRVSDLARAAGYDIDGPRGGGRSALAEAAGMTASSVGRMLSGQTMPDAYALEPLAKALRVPTMQLLVLAGVVSPSEGRTTEMQLRAELRLSSRHAHEANARAADAEAALLEARAATLRADARSARAAAQRVTERAALRHLEQVWKRWFEDAHAGVPHRDFVLGVAGDLKAVIEESKADAPAGPEDDAWGSVWLHGKWSWLTKNMTTPEREYAADCVARWSARLNADDGEPDAELEGLRWWREAA